MKRFAMLACAAALAVAGCGSKSPSSPSNAPTVFTVALNAANETPPIANSEANAKGQAIITFNTTKDSAGNITAATVDFAVTMSGFPPNSRAQAAHIHTGAAGVPGPVLIGVTTVTSGSPVQMADGTGSFTFSTSVTAADAQNILSNPAG